MDRRPVLLAGDDGVSARIREELEGLGVPVMMVEGPMTDPATWQQAGLADAQAVGLLSPDDLPNLSAALLIVELNSEVRVVVRMFSAEHAGGIETMLGARASVLSETEVAAPALVQAALSGNVGQRLTVAEHVLEVAEVDPDHPTLVVALCNADAPTDLLPPRSRLSSRVLGLTDPTGFVETARGMLPASVAHLAGNVSAREAQAARAPLRTRIAQALRLLPGRAYALAAVIATVMSVSVAVFAISDHLGFIDAIYFTAATMATVGYGDVNLSDAPQWLKLYDVGLMGVSAVLLASVLAFVADALVSARIDRALGRFPRPREGHVIVCGLGKAGSRVIATLHELGVPCIAVEQYPEAIGIAVARSLEIPVVFADMRAPGALEELRIDSARAVMAVTSDDLVNLQCAVAARSENPDVRIVMRVFDPQLAERLDHGVDLDLTRSVSALAAPAFVSALLGRPLSQSLALSNIPLRVLEAQVPAGSELVGRRIRELHAEQELRVLALDGRWRPRDDLVLEPGMDVAVVGTREATDRLALGVA